MCLWKSFGNFLKEFVRRVLFLFFRNVVFAPAEHDEYSGSCFPGVTNSLYRVAQKNISDWSSVNEQLSVLSFHILQAARVLTR